MDKEKYVKINRTEEVWEPVNNDLGETISVMAVCLLTRGPRERR